MVLEKCSLVCLITKEMVNTMVWYFEESEKNCNARRGFPWFGAIWLNKSLCYRHFALWSCICAGHQGRPGLLALWHSFHFRRGQRRQGHMACKLNITQSIQSDVLSAEIPSSPLLNSRKSYVYSISITVACQKAVTVADERARCQTFPINQHRYWHTLTITRDILIVFVLVSCLGIQQKESYWSYLMSLI